MLRGSVFSLLIYMILRDLLDPCFGLQPNTDYTSTDLAVGQEVIAFSLPKFLPKKLYLRNKGLFDFSHDASVWFVNLTRDALLVTLLLQCNDVSLNPGPPVKLLCGKFYPLQRPQDSTFKCERFNAEIGFFEDTMIL